MAEAMGGDKVSVIIPTYNRPDLLRRALSSVVDQTHRDLEILVVDDCSSIDVAPVVNGFDDGRIKLIRQECNQGAPTARNRGIGVATGRYIAFLDDDDEFFPQKIELQLADLRRKEPMYKVSFCLRQIQRDGEGVIYKMPPKRDGDHLQEALSGDDVPSTSCVLLERSCFDEVGGFRADLPCYQDWELWIRLAQRYKFAYLNEVLVTVHVHKKGRISTDHRKRMVAYPIIYEAHKSLFKQNPKAHSKFLQRYAYHCVDVGKRRQSKSLFLKSLIVYPFEVSTYLAFVLLLTNRHKKEL